MNYEERLKKMIGYEDSSLFMVLDNFINQTFEDKETGITALEKLANDRKRFNDFLTLIIQRNVDLRVIKNNYLNEQFLAQQTNNKNPDLTQVGSEMADTLNYKLHAEGLNIPILEGFQKQENDNPQVVLLATKSGFVEQLVSDGHINDGEFEERINFVINNTKQFMKNNGCENVDNSFMFHEDYNNETFKFKVYVCDMIIPDGTEKKVIRQFNAYFIDPKMNDFYQLSLSTGPFAFPTEQLKLGVIDLQSDQITFSLNSLMHILMNNLKYKN